MLINWQALVVVHSNIFLHPSCQPANPERVLRLFDRILSFESTPYVLIKSRLHDGLDHCEKFFAQNVDFEYLFRFALTTIAPKLKVKTF